jgi:hypothetical protein
MAAFLPYIAATLLFDALHVHPIAPEHGALCRHHLTEPPAPIRTSTGYECPSCNWLRNLPTQAARTWSPAVVRTSLQVIAPAATLEPNTEHLQSAWFRGPPTLA